MGNIGTAIGFPAGYMIEKLGHRWTSVTALLLTSLGGFLLYSTTLMKTFYESKAYLQDIFFLVFGKNYYEVMKEYFDILL